MQKIIAILFFILAAVAVIFLVLYPKLKEAKPRPAINNFEDCAKSGYPIIESYPRQCNTPNGRNFVESFLPER